MNRLYYFAVSGLDAATCPSLRSAPWAKLKAQMNVLGAASAARSRTAGISRPGTWCASAVGAKGDAQNRRGNSGREITAFLTLRVITEVFCPGRIWPRQGQDDASDPTWTSINPRAPQFDHSGHRGRHPSSTTVFQWHKNCIVHHKGGDWICHC
jgi:hypothetical protein